MRYIPEHDGIGAVLNTIAKVICITLIVTVFLGSFILSRAFAAAPNPIEQMTTTADGGRTVLPVALLVIALCVLAYALIRFTAGKKHRG